MEWIIYKGLFYMFLCFGTQWWYAFRAILKNTIGGQVIPFFGDVGDFKTSEQMVKTAIDNFGRIDIIVNNASSNWVVISWIWM